MGSELSFPPYLVSHALSTGHYSFLKRVEAATSSHELNTVCAQETDRIRTILAKGKLSEASAREALVLLMAITDRASATDHSHRTLGLVPALNIATGSRDGRTKAMGYLFLNENLTASDEIHLLLFNTILKDLESSHVPSIALALRSIIAVPSADIAPAVQHQLTHLVSHKSSDIRRLALAALLALSTVSNPIVLAGLKERKIWKRLEDSDPAVVLHAVRVLSRMELVGQVDTSATFSAVSGALRKVVDRPAAEVGRLPLRNLHLALFAALESMLDRLDASQQHELYKDLQSLLVKVADESGSDALVLPIYSILVKIPQSSPDRSSSTVLLPVRRALLSNRPSGQIWALRCLAAIPVSQWSGDSEGSTGLGEEAMGILMGGLDSRDQGIRIETLKLLIKLSPDLPLLQLDRIMDATPSTASVRDCEGSLARALEIIELLFTSNDKDNGAQAADRAWKALQAAHSTSSVDVVLEEGASHLLDWIGRRSTEWQAAFTSTFLERASTSSPSPSPTSSIIIAAVASEYAASLASPAETSVLLGRLLEGGPSASIQEALLFSLAGVCTHLEDGRPDPSVLDVVDRLRQASGKHLRHRCDAFRLIASAPKAFLPLKDHLPDTSLPSVVYAFETHARSLAPPPRPSRGDERSSSTGSPSARSRDLSASALRYDAYPSASEADLAHKLEKKKRKERRDREKENRRRVERSRATHPGEDVGVSVTAGDLALLGLEEGELDVETRNIPDSADDSNPFRLPHENGLGTPKADLVSFDGESPFLESPMKRAT